MIFSIIGFPNASLFCCISSALCEEELTAEDPFALLAEIH